MTVLPPPPPTATKNATPTPTSSPCATATLSVNVKSKLEATFEKESETNPGTWQKRRLVCEGDSITYYQNTMSFLKAGTKISLSDCRLVDAPSGSLFLDNGKGRVLKFRQVNGQYNVVQEWKSVLIEAFRLGTTST